MWAQSYEDLVDKPDAGNKSNIVTSKVIPIFILL